MSGEYSEDKVNELTDMVNEYAQLWGVSSSAQIKLLNLSENATFLISDQENARDIILRVQRPGYSDPTEIKSELAWVAALSAEHIIDTAEPIKSINGNYLEILTSKSGLQRYAVAFSRVYGHEPVADDDLPKWFEKIGEIAAKMHIHSKSWKKPKWFKRKLWDYSGMMGPVAYWGSWDVAKGLTDDDKTIISQTLKNVKEKVEHWGYSSEVFGLVHSDLRTANLIVNDETLYVIDFDDTGFSWYLYDFASSLSFLEDLPEASQLMQSWIKGYEKVKKLSTEAIAMLPVFAILRRILLTAWIASHSEIPFAKEKNITFAKGTVELCKKYLKEEFLA